MCHILGKCCIVTTNYTYTYACRTQWHYKDEQQSLEKYTSHFIWKGWVWEGVGDRTELQYIDPHSYGHNSVSFPFSWAAPLGPWGPSLSGCWFSLPHLISNSSDSQLIEFPVHCVIWLFNAHLLLVGVTNRTHSTCPRSRLYSDIPRTDAPVIYTGAFPILTTRPGRRSIYNINMITRWCHHHIKRKASKISKPDHRP